VNRNSLKYSKKLYFVGILAAVIPKLDLFTGLVGAICISTLATLIPVTLYILVHYEDFGKFKWRLILGVFMFSVAFIAAICAVTTNLILIVEFLIYGYTHEENHYNL